MLLERHFADSDLLWEYSGTLLFFSLSQCRIVCIKYEHNSAFRYLDIEIFHYVLSKTSGHLIEGNNKLLCLRLMAKGFSANSGIPRLIFFIKIRRDESRLWVNHKVIKFDVAKQLQDILHKLEIINWYVAKK